MSETLLDKASGTFADWRQQGGDLMLSSIHHRAKANQAHLDALRSGSSLAESNQHEKNEILALAGGLAMYAAGAAGGIVVGALRGR